MNAVDHKFRAAVAEELGKEPMLYYRERKLLRNEQFEEFIQLVLKRKRSRCLLIALLVIGFVSLVLLASIIRGGDAGPGDGAATANWLGVALFVSLGTLPVLRSVHRLELLQSLLAEFEADSALEERAA